MTRGFAIGATSFVALVLAGCGSPAGTFAKNCQPEMEAEGQTEAAAKMTCSCAAERLDGELSGKQMKMASQMVGMSNGQMSEKYGNDNEEAQLVAERMQGAVKSCASGM